MSKKSGATIVATPQIRKVNPDVTRFMPTSLKVKRAAGIAVAVVVVAVVAAVFVVVVVVAAAAAAAAVAVMMIT